MQNSVKFPYKIYKGNPCPIININIQGPKGWLKIESYVDSGAFISIFTIEEAQNLGLDIRKGKQTYMTVGDGSLIPAYLFKLPVKIGDVSFKATIGFSPRLGVGFNLLGDGLRDILDPKVR